MEPRLGLQALVHLAPAAHEILEELWVPEDHILLFIVFCAVHFDQLLHLLESIQNPGQAGPTHLEIPFVDRLDAVKHAISRGILSRLDPLLQHDGDERILL
ncbi:hypothetical protein D3C87_1808470 [compost metagenome]